MSDTLGQFSRRCLDAARQADLQAFSATRAVAIDLTGDVRRGINRAAPGRSLNAGRRGRRVRIGARYRLDPARNRAIVEATGPLQLVERDTKAHSEPRARTKRSRRARKTLYIPGIGYRRTVRHPGTHGKHPFAKALTDYESAEKASKIYGSYMNRMLRKAANS